MIKGKKNGKVILIESDDGKLKINKHNKKLVESAHKQDADIEFIEKEIEKTKDKEDK